MRSMILLSGLLFNAFQAGSGMAANYAPPLDVPVAPEVAAPAMNQTTPLMVIRFNQQKVYYDRSLYTAVSKAVAAKPTVMFDLVSVVPESGDAARDARSAQAAEDNLGKVVASMNQMGVPQSRLTITRRPVSGAGSSEVQIFVR